MKTELMAAAACWRKVRASGRACLESKGNPYRLFRAAAIALAIVIVPATVLLGDRAFADGGSYSNNFYPGSWHRGEGCASSYRISHRDTGCMHAWWDNTPPRSTGFSGGSTYGARNKCPDYGAMKANIEMEEWSEHFHMSNGDKKRGRYGAGDVRDISCCLNKSDLCWKWSVEAQDGKIKVWKGTGTDYRWVNVRTHAKRYDFCAENPDNVYCVNDPEGDAFTALTCEQSSTMCTAQDCEDAYTESDLHASCSSNARYSFKYVAGGSAAGANCKISAGCGDAAGFGNIRWPLDDVDDLVYCPNATGMDRFQVGSC